MKFFFLSLFLVASPAAFAQEVLIATSGETAPANAKNLADCQRMGLRPVSTVEGTGLCGFEVELLNAVCAERGWVCRWTTQPLGPKADPAALPDLLAQLQDPANPYQLVVNYMRGTTARMAALSASATYYEGFPSIYASVAAQKLADSGQIIRNGKNFPVPVSGKIRIATVGFYEAEVKSHYAPAELELVEVRQVPSLEEQIRLLASGEIDFVFGPDHQRRKFEAAGQLVFEARPLAVLSNSIELGSRVYGAPTALGRSLIEQFNGALVALKASGAYDRLFAAYGLQHTWGCVNGPKLDSTREECERKRSGK